MYYLIHNNYSINSKNILDLLYSKLTIVKWVHKKEISHSLSLVLAYSLNWFKSNWFIIQITLHILCHYHHHLKFLLIDITLTTFKIFIPNSSVAPYSRFRDEYLTLVQPQGFAWVAKRQEGVNRRISWIFI